MYGPLSEISLKTVLKPLALYLEESNEKIAILPLNKINLKKALNKSKYLFIASHGYNGHIVFDSKSYSYTDFHTDFYIDFDKSNLKFVYFSACKLGVGGNKLNWQRIMSPAEIIIFNRNSAVMEHAFWILFNSIDVVKKINKDLIVVKK